MHHRFANRPACHAKNRTSRQKIDFCHLHNTERIQCRFDNHASAHTAYFADDTSTERYQKTNTLHLITPLVLRRLTICRTGSCPRFLRRRIMIHHVRQPTARLFDLLSISFICNAIDHWGGLIQDSL